jgi:hypothetical protein
VLNEPVSLTPLYFQIKGFGFGGRRACLFSGVVTVMKLSVYPSSSAELESDWRSASFHSGTLLFWNEKSF